MTHVTDEEALEGYSYAGEEDRWTRSIRADSEGSKGMPVGVQVVA
jgi:hypothetical protein